MIEIIPAIDLIDGKCVRLTQGDYGQKKVYNEDPLEVAKQFEGAGIKRLHLVDLDGAKQKKIINHSVLERIATHTSLHIDFGGGIQSDQDILIAFSSGARQVTGGSIAVTKPDLFQNWIKTYGSSKIILGSDVRNRKIAVSGWQEQTNVDLFEFLRDYLAKGIQYTICTDVSKDGLLQGPSMDLYADMLKTFPSLKLIASGGVTTIDDIEHLQELGCYGVIVGKAFYEGLITLKELQKYV